MKFETIYNNHYKELYFYILKISKSKELAEDILHDLFLKVYEKIDKLESLINIRAYLYKSATNSFINFTKLKSNQNQELFDNQVYIMNEFDDFEIFEIINKIKEPEKTVFILKKFEDFTYDEIAEILNCSVRKVKYLMKEAILKLKKEYFSEV